MHFIDRALVDIIAASELEDEFSLLFLHLQDFVIILDCLNLGFRSPMGLDSLNVLEFLQRICGKFINLTKEVLFLNGCK
jgi:hypothetical protein